MTTSLLDQTEDNQELDPNTDYLKLLTGPGGKFYDEDPQVALQKMAKGKYLGDIHAKTLESRMDELREDYVKASAEAKAAKRMEELLDRLDNTNTDLTSRNNTQSNEDNKTAFNPEQLKSLVSTEVQQLKAQERSEQNFNLVMDKVREQYGDKFSSVLSEQAKELDMSEDEVNSLARRNPKAFIKTFGLGEQREMETFQTPPQSSTRQSSFSPKIQRRTYGYYQNLRKENPNLYYDPKIAVQMDKDSQALGEDFFDV